MSGQYTPGPWKAQDAPENDALYFVWNADGDYLTTDPDEHEANARLIAAAPELLEALELITDQLERVGDTRPGKDGDFIDAARAAIAKARGGQS